MALISPPVCDFGWQAPGFDLPGTDGQRHRLDSVAGGKGTLVMFICNHCPYVLRVLDQIIADAKALQAQGIGVVAISSNDATTHPQDSFERMAEMAQARGFPFPYLYDEDQTVARAYDAACTPDFFGLDASGGLQYRGRIDELRGAMEQVAATGQGPRDQTPSMGCSIKWRA